MAQLTIENGTVSHVVGGATPLAGGALSAMSITAPQPGHTGYGDGYWSSRMARAWFTFTPETTGRVYIGAWPSYWANASGDRVGELPMQIMVAPPNPDGSTGDTLWDYTYQEQWDPLSSAYVDVLAGHKYTILASRDDWDDPPEGLTAQLVLVVSEVHAFTPWQADPTIPTVLLDGVPYAPAQTTIPEEPDTDYPAPDDRLGSGRWFVGRN